MSADLSPPGHQGANSAAAWAHRAGWNIFPVIRLPGRMNSEILNMTPHPLLLRFQFSFVTIRAGKMSPFFKPPRILYLNCVLQFASATGAVVMCQNASHLV